MSDKRTHIVFPLFEGMTPLDFVAPYQAFSIVPGARHRRFGIPKVELESHVIAVSQCVRQDRRDIWTRPHPSESI